MTVVVIMCVYLHTWNKFLGLLVAEPGDRELQWHCICQIGMG